MTVQEIKKEIVKRLTSTVGFGEAEAMMRMMMHDILGMTPIDMALHPDRTVENFTQHRLSGICRRIINGEPIQYVLGHAQFHGLDIKVSPAVLIPRPETSELVDIISDRANGSPDLRVCDLCTGSGCIALALGRSLVYPQITAVDNSPEALDIAAENARMLNLDINFVDTDVLRLQAPVIPAYDIIVSNPPYVAESEKKDMDARVLDNEPPAALFVPDSDPLIFYRAISQYALGALVSGGSLYFEINPLFAGKLHTMLVDDGWTDTQIIRDYRGKNRFAICQR